MGRDVYYKQIVSGLFPDKQHQAFRKAAIA